MGNFTIFEQNESTIPSFVYKMILKHQANEIHHVLKEEQVMVCSSPLYKPKCENLKRISAINPIKIQSVYD